MLELRGLTRGYGDLVALDDLSFTYLPEDHGQTFSEPCAVADQGQLLWSLR